MPRTAQLSFSNIRTWDGRQDRAFEELTYQLFKDDAPAGATAVRTGSPDGGVEWYATLTDASEWGWQAKFVRFESLLGALRESVERVATERPKTKRLTFLISINLATSTRRGQIKSQRDKYNDAVAAWKSDIPGAAKMDFALIQGSDVLARLSRPEHRGRQWFWWNDEVFTDDWLTRQHQIQAGVAHDRYRPDLQVDLPIQQDLAALGFDDAVVAEVRHRVRRFRVGLARIRIKTEGPQGIRHALTAVKGAGQGANGAIDALRLLPPFVESDIGALKAAVRTFLDACSAVEEKEFALERRSERSSRAKSAPSRPRDKMPYRYGFREARDAAVRLEEYLDSSMGRLLIKGLYFLEGVAGVGKTHLLLDAVDKALSAGRPAAALMGGNFGRGGIWQSITEQLGLPDIGRDVLLGAMDAAGEASSESGTRFILAIDALNDATDPDFWRRALPQLRAAVGLYPHVGLAVSCRDTYIDLVDDAGERTNWVTQVHPGFAGREIEAAQRYFEAYGLEAPRIPLLMPEFTVPLFMRMYCEGLREQSLRSAPQGHESRVKIFDRFLAASLDQAARRLLTPAATTQYQLDSEKDRVRRVLDGLLGEMAATGSEWIPRGRGEELATAAAGGPGHGISVLAALQAESVLSREHHWTLAGTEEAFRVLFQAFSDHLILGRRLASVVDPASDRDFKKWLADDASLGILEAAAVVIPERFGLELPDLLELKPISARRLRHGRGHRDWRTERAYTSVVETLPHRSAGSVTERTVELLNDTLPLRNSETLYRTIVQCAPQPGHRLNGATLHQHLASMSMPQRDRDFGFATYDVLEDLSSPWASLARWASRGPYPDYDPEVVELAAIPLVWLMSSPNRYMRDWVTKALVQLLRGHLDVAWRLLDRFWAIDDPYVVQRIVVICYAALLRAPSADSEAGRTLSRRVVELVFAEPLRADELLLDAGQGVAVWASARGLLTPAREKAATRPFRIDRPRRPPSEAAIEKRFGYRQAREASYNSLWMSLMSMGDFGRYVIEAAMHYFTRFPINQPYPRRQEPRPSRARRLPTRVQSLIDGLPPDELLELIRTIPDESSSRAESARRRRYRADFYPDDVAKRWVLARSIRLGWAPRLFAEEDRFRGHDLGRSAHKAERWGKKYQWMAFHELLSRVAANFHFRRWGEDAAYPGLHALIGKREIDPTVPPVDYRMFTDRSASRGMEWGSCPVDLVSWPPRQLDFARYGGDVAAFVADAETEPAINDLVSVRDRTGITWVVLDGYMHQGDPTADEDWRGLQQPVEVHSLFVAAAEAAPFLQQVPGLEAASSVDLVDSHGHVDCCWVREAGRSHRECPHYHRELREFDGENGFFHVVDTTEHVVWERGLLDCSIENGVRVALPSSYIQRRAELSMDDHGPTWRANGELAFVYVGDPTERNEALLVRREWLLAFLEEHDLELILLQRHVRWEIRDWALGRRTEDDPGVLVYSSGRLDKDGRLSLSRSIREPR